ncbi:MAG: cytochrome [Dehalococcoidia bacterium]|nr:cytochrome [Dehalococcoidia bacterium]
MKERRKRLALGKIIALVVSASAAVIGAALLAGLAGPTAAEATPSGAGDKAKGEYLVRLVGCTGCHGRNFAGQRPGGPTSGPATAPYGTTITLPGGAGTVPVANITPDPETGIGAWSDQDIIRAIQDGVRPDGRILHTSMPYGTYHAIPDDEMEHIVAFLRSIDPVKNKPPARQLQTEPREPSFAASSPRFSPGEGPRRGELLVTLARCTGCHTPRLPDGSVDRSKFLAGNVLRPPGQDPEPVANITPDPETGIGDWSVEQITRALKTKLRPNGKEIKGAMADQIKNRFQYLSDTDARSIALYLKSIPPVEYRAEEALQPAGSTPAPSSVPAPLTLPRTGDRTSSSALLLVALGALLAGAGWLTRRHLQRSQ